MNDLIRALLSRKCDGFFLQPLIDSIILIAEAPIARAAIRCVYPCFINLRARLICSVVKIIRNDIIYQMFIFNHRQILPYSPITLQHRTRNLPSFKIGIAAISLTRNSIVRTLLRRSLPFIL